MHWNSIKQKRIKQKLKKLSEEAAAKELRAQNFNKDETAQNHGNFLCALDRYLSNLETKKLLAATF